MRSNRRWWLALAALLALGCDDGGSEDPIEDAAPTPMEAGPSEDAAPMVPADAGEVDEGVAVDEGLEEDASAVDAAPDGPVADAAWLPLDPELLPPDPQQYRAGTAVARMPVPVGIGTSGFAPTAADSHYTPYAETYPGTKRLHTHPEVRVLIVESGAGNRLILMRVDTIGVTAQIRRTVVDLLEPALGQDVDRQLIIAATHTHSGPNRMLDRPYWALIQDTFWPELYVRTTQALADAVLAAHADLEPARVGWGLAMTTDIHSDRRCANAEETEPELPILRVERADGVLKGLALFHAVHGTALDMDDYALSRDVSGAIETKVAELFDHPVFVMFLNGAAADMGIGSPQSSQVEGAAEWPEHFLKTERIGDEGARAVAEVVGDIETEAEGIVHSRTERVPIEVGLLGYGPDEFSFEHGAVYCGAGRDERCLGEPPSDEALLGCIPFPEVASAPKQAPITVAQIGDKVLLTGPGEFAIALGRQAREAAAEATGHEAVFIGYAQEYTGYNLPEDDWWQGGYESSGALWGPKQGTYLTEAVIALARSYANPRLPLPFEAQEAIAVPGPYAGFEPFRTHLSPVPAAIEVEPAEVYAPNQIVELRFVGGDPWFGTPVVSLERAEGENWAPVLRPNTTPVTSDDYEMQLLLEPDPPYQRREWEADRRPTERSFHWTAQLPALRPFGGGPELSGGTFRFVARGTVRTLAMPDPANYELLSRPFRVE